MRTTKWLLKRRGIDIEDKRRFRDDLRDKLKELHIREIDLRLMEGDRVCRINHRGA